MIRLAVITGSTRPGRRGDLVATWVAETARHHLAQLAAPVSVDLVDLADFGLPLLAESAPAMFGQYEHDYTRRWAATVGAFDGFIFVTPEYNHSLPAVLKNAIDYLFAEWNDKAAGIVSYGVNGGTRAGEHLRQVLAEVKVATVRTHVALSMFDDFAIRDPLARGDFTPRENQAPTVHRLLDELISWAGALQRVRSDAAAISA